MQANFPVMPFDHPTFAPTEIRREESVYLRERIRAEREECVIYVCDRLTVFQAIGNLVRGYSPQNVKCPPTGETEKEVEK